MGIRYPRKKENGAVKVKSEDPETPGYLREDRAKRDICDFELSVRPPWLAREKPGTVTIPQYRLNTTKQHTPYL